MLTLTTDQLAEVEELSAYFLSPEEIAIVLEVDSVDFEDALLDETGLIFRAYRKGYLKSKVELRKSIIALAKQGSGPAQSLATRMVLDLEAHSL